MGEESTGDHKLFCNLSPFHLLDPKKKKKVPMYVSLMCSMGLM